jgi:DNA-binding PucR family transcriptional regulator
LLGTVWTYFEKGHSLEATARELFVHPNTVRYRLKKVSEVLDWDPGAPRDALTLHLAIILGAMSEPNTPPRASGSSL